MPLFLVVQILGGEVGRGRGLPRFRCELVEALRRIREARVSSAIAPWSWMASASLWVRRVCEPGIVDARVAKRGFSRGQRRPRLVKVEPMGSPARPARPRPVRIRARTIQRKRHNADVGFITG